MSLSAFLNMLTPINAPRPNMSNEYEFDMLLDDGFLCITPSVVNGCNYVPPPAPKKRRPFVIRMDVKCKKILKFDCKPHTIIIGFDLGDAL